MRVEEAVQCMSKSYLHRIIDSFTKDLHKPDVDESRALIIRNSKELADAEHISTKLSRAGVFHEQVLMKMLLESLLAADGHRASEAELIEATQRREQEVIDAADTTGLVGARGYRDHQRPRARAEKVPVRTDGVTITTSA